MASVTECSLAVRCPLANVSHCERARECCWLRASASIQWPSPWHLCPDKLVPNQSYATKLLGAPSCSSSSAPSCSVSATLASSSRPITVSNARVVNAIPSDPNYDVHKMIRDFWSNKKRKMETMTVNELREASRAQELPLARVKKIMKLDEEVRNQMIAQDAPLLLSVAAEMFVEELTLRAWETTEEGKRKTLQKTDISAAISNNEHFDFLIDIVPREKKPPRNEEVQYMTVENNEMFVRLENGQFVQATPIGHPIQLNSTAANELSMHAQVAEVGGSSKGGVSVPIRVVMTKPSTPSTSSSQ